MLELVMISAFVATSGAIPDCTGSSIFMGDGDQIETDGGHLRGPTDPTTETFGRGILLSGTTACLEADLGWNGALPLTWTCSDAVLRSETLSAGTYTRRFDSSRLELRDAQNVLLLGGQLSGPVLYWNIASRSGSVFASVDFTRGTLLPALPSPDTILMLVTLTDAGDPSGWSAAVQMDVAYAPYAQRPDMMDVPAIPSTWGGVKSSYRASR